jgi:hypothetical protein
MDDDGCGDAIEHEAALAENKALRGEYEALLAERSVLAARLEVLIARRDAMLAQVRLLEEALVLEGKLPAPGGSVRRRRSSGRKQKR